MRNPLTDIVGYLSAFYKTCIARGVASDYLQIHGPPLP